MLLAGSIMFVVAQVPPQRLMSFAVPAVPAGVGLLIAVAVFGITKKGAKRWDQRRAWSSSPARS
jgi:rod shape determining protein RodA